MSFPPPRHPAAAAAGSRPAAPAAPEFVYAAPAPQPPARAAQQQRASSAAAAAASSSTFMRPRVNISAFNVQGRYQPPSHISASSTSSSSAEAAAAAAAAAAASGTSSLLRYSRPSSASAAAAAAATASSRNQSTFLLLPAKRTGAPLQSDSSEEQSSMELQRAQPQPQQPPRMMQQRLNLRTGTARPPVPTWNEAAQADRRAMMAAAAAAGLYTANGGGAAASRDSSSFEGLLAPAPRAQQGSGYRRSSSSSDSASGSFSGSSDEELGRGHKRSGGTSRRRRSSDGSDGFNSSELRQMFSRSNSSSQPRRNNASSSRSRSRSGSSTSSRSVASMADEAADPNCVMAICEFRSRELVGFAVMDWDLRELTLCQYGDNHRYGATATWIKKFMPKVVFVPEKMVDSRLVDRIRDEFGSHTRAIVDIRGVRRNFFNESSGLALLSNLATKDSFNLLHLDSNKYLCVSAANCLIKIMEAQGEMHYAAHSLSVVFRNMDGRVNMDLKACQNLELLPQFVRGGASNPLEIQRSINFLFALPAPDELGGMGGRAGRFQRRRVMQSCLFDIFPCRTPGGFRCVRNSLLQPVSDPDTILSRLDMVDLLIADEVDLFALCDLLPKFSDLDRLSAGMVQTPKSPNARTTLAQMNLIISLGRSLNLLPKLTDVVQSLLAHADEGFHAKQRQLRQQSRNASVTPALDALPEHSSQREMLQTMINNFAEDHYAQLQSTIAEWIDLSRVEVTGKGHATQTNRYKFIFAIRSGKNGLLDVARRTFLEAIQELEEARDRLAAGFDLPNKADMILVVNASRGYHLSIATAKFQALPLQHQREFVQVWEKGGRTFCSTERIISLDTRQELAYHEIVLMAGRVIEEILEEIREHLSWLAVVSEAIAWLDLVCSFADLVTRSPGIWVRPELTHNGEMVIKDGRHPLVQNATNETMVPNDVRMDQTSNFRIVTGANGSGKSTYLRMIGVVCVLAHIGCYVPATYACIRLTDQILTRMGSAGDGDGTEFSSFFAECKELAYLMENSSLPKQRALVLIDELGRATSSSDGVGICWATAEALSARPACYTVLATHFIELCGLPAIYPTIRNLHLRVSVHDAPGTGRQLRFLFKVASEQIEDEIVDLQYGIEIARMAAFPLDVIEEARQTGKQLREQVSLQRLSASKSSDSAHGPNSSHPRTHVPTTLLRAPTVAAAASLPHLYNTFVESCHTFADKSGDATVWPSMLAAFQKLDAQYPAGAPAAPDYSSSVEPITNGSLHPADVDEIKIDDDGVLHPPGAQSSLAEEAAAGAEIVEHTDGESNGVRGLDEELSIINASTTAMQEME